MKSAGCDGLGRFAFTSAVGGEYSVCFSSNVTRWGGDNSRRFRVDLKLQIGDVGIDYAEVAKKEHLTELEVEVGSTLEHSHVVVDRLQFFAREYEVPLAILAARTMLPSGHRSRYHTFNTGC